MVFTGVMGSRDGAEACRNAKKMKFKYEIKGTAGDDSGACAGKIKPFTVLSDPRPLLERSDKK
jgi:hypothetical protein